MRKTKDVLVVQLLKRKDKDQRLCRKDAKAQRERRHNKIKSV